MRREGDELAKAFKLPPPQVIGTGFPAIDNALSGGFRTQQSSLLGGFTGHAKSSFGEQVALYASAEVPTLYLTLEMGERETRLRMGAKLAKTSVSIFEKTGLDVDTQTQLNARMLTIYQPSKPTIETIEMLVRKRAHKLIVIDDVRSIDGVLMTNSRKTSNAHEIAQRITMLAEKNDVHILALHQLKPTSFKLGPAHWEFQDSTVFEQKSCNTFTVFRPHYEYGPPSDMFAELRIRKCRRGTPCKIFYRWVGETQSFWAFSDVELDTLECLQPKHKKGAPSE